jgi:hypothetical protein
LGARTHPEPAHRNDDAPAHVAAQTFLPPIKAKPTEITIRFDTGECSRTHRRFGDFLAL